MKITIHRGIDQIGGCITEIATDNSRILIDLGQNLPDGEGIVDDDLANREAIGKITQGIDAIFYTHYHGDHLGLFHYVPDNVPQYIGKVAKQVTLCKHRQLSYIKGRKKLSQEEISKLEKMSVLIPEQTINVRNIKVTPYFVSHSAYDAYMFLIEVDDKKVLHIGDFRGHGYLSKGLLPTIKKLILPRGKVDFLITEGTMLSRLGERVMSENELQREASQIMARYRNVFVMCSSTDMERLASFYAANKNLRNRPLICDRFQKNILEIFTQSAGNHTSLFRFDKVYDFNSKNTKLIHWMEDKGFCMFVRATDKFKDYYQTLVSRLEPKDTVLIYSMWKEYINDNGKHAIQRYIEFVSMFPNMEKLHTSGHASPEFLAEVCNLVNPTLGIIPIHSENSASYSKLPIEEHLQQRILTSSKTINKVEIKINQNI
ncbi:MAG: MBL fold metallo-hydrolase [Petrimonas sp.]|uniref:MBL fold metallo-hydrolase n=1 Tax=Petrimonas sp. TaxID=2023866 RepID=UPI000A571751|nr:MBL fold metallo-hydrolase [Petrimonas sp.]MEA4978410.1 MBL fold metallo-hydrolase [Petrimonas sp.]MEA5044493.1 MBL fold metallo-hydrolase [Petrimonas sp.]MEA5062569.1 MBL fold metallo-hydrolase [Petrimonas sp.]